MVLISLLDMSLLQVKIILNLLSKKIVYLMENIVPLLILIETNSLLEEMPALFEQCSMIVGMHPDQATGCLVEASGEQRFH